MEEQQRSGTTFSYWDGVSRVSEWQTCIHCFAQHSLITAQNIHTRKTTCRCGNGSHNGLNRKADGANMEYLTLTVMVQVHSRIYGQFFLCNLYSSRILTSYLWFHILFTMPLLCIHNMRVLVLFVPRSASPYCSNICGNSSL